MCVCRVPEVIEVPGELQCCAGKGKGVWEGGRCKWLRIADSGEVKEKDLKQLEDFRNQDGGMY